MEINNIIEKAKEFEKNPPSFYNPEKAKKTLEEFNIKFNYEKIKGLTLDEYVLGTGNNETFSYWLEFKDLPGTSISGNVASKFYIYTNKKLFQNKRYKIGTKMEEVTKEQAEIEFEKVKDTLIKILDYSKKDDFIAIDELEILSSMVKSKIVFMYYPDKISTIAFSKRIEKVCELLGVDFDSKHPIDSNQKLMEKINSIDFFNSWDSYKKGSFLNYLYYNVATKIKPDNFSDLLESKKQIILYGPPGTGKTFKTKQYATEFLAGELNEL